MPAPIDQQQIAGASWLVSFLTSLPGGALAGVISSWALANKKAKSDLVQSILDARTDLLCEVHVYWLSDARDQSLEKSITRQQMKFDVKLRDFFTRYGRNEDRGRFIGELTVFNARLTAAPFGTAEFQQSPHLSAAARQRADDVMKFIC